MLKRQYLHKNSPCLSALNLPNHACSHHDSIQKTINQTFMMASTVALNTTDKLGGQDVDGAATAVVPPRPRIPPLSFALVSPGVYRSGCPMPLNFPFLTSLHLKSIIYLADQDLPIDLCNWTAQNNVQVFHFRVQQVRGAGGNIKSDLDHMDPHITPERTQERVENDPESMKKALELLLDMRNFPVLIHSNKGKHRSGVLVACMRKLLQNWEFSSVELEYHYFSGNKGKADIEFIEAFQPILEYDKRWAPEWLKYLPEEGILSRTTTYYS